MTETQNENSPSLIAVIGAVFVMACITLAIAAAVWIANNPPRLP